MKLTIVTSPRKLPFPDEDRRALKALYTALTREFKIHQRWTAACTQILQNHPKCLFLYDRFEYSQKKAFGTDDKIALNPVMIMCYHPDCVKTGRGPHKLRRMFKLNEFLLHLEDHVDEIGGAMQIRFNAIDQNPLATKEELDNLALAPSELIQTPHPDLGAVAVSHIEAYGIQHIMYQCPLDKEIEYLHSDVAFPSNPLYICHWKDLLISSDIINSSSLTFQEDDAYIHTVLSYPNPVKDWSIWGTISLYAMKFMCSISGTGLNLHRGITFNRITTKKEKLPDIKEFAKNINHASPSITNVQSSLPALKFENKTFHVSELLFQIQLLMRTPHSFMYQFPDGVIRFPVAAGIDEQEINQGTYIVNNELCGLAHKMTAADVKRVGLENLATYIAEHNNFVSAAREYHLTDLGGIFCSNVYTSFDSHTLKHDECISELNKMVNTANSCESCLQQHLDCMYDDIRHRCNNCVQANIDCVGLLVFHVYWDMGSSHKKTAKVSSDSLTLGSSVLDMMNPRKYTIGFGGLHLAKALVNMMRNYVLQFGGEYCGVDILVSLRSESALLQQLKNSVFVGKDRQSDLLSYLTVGPLVQEALVEQKNYCIQRIPEKILSYKPNAATQKKILFVVDMCCNRNGDVFMLDAGASCIHVVDRSRVAAVHIIGKYCQPNLHIYPKQIKNVTKKLRLSSSLCDMSIDADDNICISDSGRKEVIYIPNCLRAKKSTNTKFHIMKVKGILSASCTINGVYSLREKRSGKLVQLMTFKLPTKKKKRGLHLEYDVVLKVKFTFDVEKLFFVPFSRRFGSMGNDKSIRIHYHTAKSTRHVSETFLDLYSSCKPCTSSNGMLVTSVDSSIVVNKLLCAGKSTSLTYSRLYEVDDMVDAISINGEVISVALFAQNNCRLLQFGPLSFFINFASAVCSFYGAIGYVPPTGKRAKQSQCTSLQESLNKAEPCRHLLEQMQRQTEDRTPGRSSFAGADGMPCSDTIKCLQLTTESWGALIERCEALEPGSSARIHAPSVTSEKNVEHAFGFYTKKGQGHNQMQEEYIIAKRKHVIDFQLRMCKMPFCQYTKESVQDKGYQQLEGDRCVLTKKELDIIFDAKDREDCMEETPEISEEEKNLLKKAFLLSKSVPRQSNRAKWRERSGFQPNMLVEKSSPGRLYTGDLVCCRSATNEVLYYVVEKETLLNDMDVHIPVVTLDGGQKVQISNSKLICERGHIMALPSSLYSVACGELVLSTSAAKAFQATILQEVELGRHNGMNDDDWAMLVEEN